MRERVGQRKTATTNSFSISTLRQPTRGFGKEPSHVITTERQAVQKPPSYDFSRISMRPVAKLTVNKLGDYEQEADRVAQHLMQPVSNPGNQQQLKLHEAPHEEEQAEMKLRVQLKSGKTGMAPQKEKPKASKTPSFPKAPVSNNTKANNPKDKFGFGKDNKAKDSKALERTYKQKQDDLNQALAEAHELIKDDNTEAKVVKKRLPGIKSKYKITTLELVTKSQDGAKETVYVKGKVNPEGNTPTEQIIGDNIDAEKLVRDAKSDWKKVKAKYLSKPEIMKQIIAFREKEVARIITKVKTKVSGFKVEAFGSTDLTSDYDVTFNASGNQSVEIQAVKLFNQFFREDWGKESGTVFDTNVYTTGHMPVGEGKDEKEQDKKEIEWQITQKGEESSQKNQDVMSLLKIRRFMSDAQWKKYKLKMLRDAHENQKSEINSRFNQVDTIYREVNSEMKKMINNLNQKVIKLPKLLAGLRASYIKKTNPDAEMEASNRLYEKYLDKVDETFQELNKVKIEVKKAGVRTKEQSEKLDELTLKLQELRSKALVFANEAYHTGGAVEHVVLNQQMKLGISVTNQQYLQSINEQTGFAVEQINLSLDLGTALWKSAKYIDRLCDAINKIDIKDFKKPQEHEKVLNLAQEMLKIKKGKDNYQNLKTDKEKSEAAEIEGKKNGYTSQKEFLNAVLKLNREVNQEIRTKSSKKTN